MGVFFLFSKTKPKYIVTLLLLFLVAFCVGFRVDVGSDWEGYVSYYNTNQPPDGRDILEMEPLFRLSRYLCYSLGLSYQCFFLIFSYLSLFAFIKVSRNFGIRNYYLVLQVYISLSFCAFQLNLMRIGIMCSCVWLALSYRNESLLKTLLWMAVGTGFHYLCLAILPIVLFANKNFSSKWYLIIISSSFVALITNIGVTIVDSIPFLSTLGRASDYLDPDSSFRNGNGITIGVLFNIAFCAYLRIVYKELYDKDRTFKLLINVMLGAIVFTCWLNGLGIIAQRGGQSMNVALCYIWPVFLSRKTKDRRVIWTLILTVYLLLFFMKSFSPDGLDERNLVPYRIEIASLLR